MSHTSALLRDARSTDRADVHVSDDVTTVSSLSDVAQTQQVPNMAVIRLADVLITKQITYTRIIKP